MPPAQAGTSKRKTAPTVEADPPSKRRLSRSTKEPETVLVPNTSDIEDDDEKKNLDENELVLVRAERDKAFVGFGIMTFATRKDPGQPTLHIQSINPRDVTEANLAKLKKWFSGNEDFSLLDRYSSSNALTMLADTQFLEQSTITKDPAADQYQVAKWIPTNQALFAQLANGNHRRVILRQVAAKEYNAYSRLLEKLRKADKGTVVTNKMMEARMQFEKEILPPLMKWLVRFYDTTIIDASPYKSEILLDLASNKAVAQNEDTQNNALHLAIHHILCEPFEEREDKISRSAKNSPMVERMPAPLKTIFKDSALFLVLTRLHQFNLLWAPEIRLSVNSIKAWRVSASPMMQLILFQGTCCLEFLFSDFNPDLASSDKDIRHSLIPLFNTDPVVPNIADEVFFTIVHEAYTSHIYPHRESFGLLTHSVRDSTAYSKAHTEYAALLVKRLGTWATDRIKFLKTTAAPPANAEHVLQTFPRRLQVVLNRNVFQTVNFGMPMLKTRYPMLSGCFIIDIAKQLDAIKVQLSMALAWIDPYLGLNFPSGQATGLMPPLIHAMTRIAPQTLKAEVIVHKVLGCIFNQRGAALLRMKTLTAGCTSTVDHIQLTDIDKSEDWATAVKLALTSFVKAWRVQATSKISAKDLSESPPSVDSMPKEELKNGAMSKLDKQEREIIISALVSTYYPWASGDANTAHNRNVSTVNHAFESLKFALFTERYFAKDSTVAAFRIQLAELIAHYSKFKWFWDGIVLTEENNAEELPSSQAEFTSRSATGLSAEANSIATHTKSVVQQITTLLAHKDCGAIPVIANEKGKVNYQVSEDVHDAAQKLFQAIAVASTRAQRMYTHPTSDRRIQLPRSEIQELTDAISPSNVFTPAPSEATDLFYSQSNMEDLAQVKSFGIGSLLLQKKIAAAAARQEKLANKKSQIKAGKRKMLDDPKLEKIPENLPPSSDYGDGGFKDEELMAVVMSGEEENMYARSSQLGPKNGQH